MIGFLAAVVLSAVIALLIDAYKEEIKAFFKSIFSKDG